MLNIVIPLEKGNSAIGVKIIISRDNRYAMRIGKVAYARHNIINHIPSSLAHDKYFTILRRRFGKKRKYSVRVT